MSEPKPAAAPAARPESRRDIIALVGGLAGVATLFALGIGWLLARNPPALAPKVVGLAAVLMASIFYLQTRTLVLPWRSQGAAMYLDEVAVFLALVLLPPYTLPLVLIPATVATQIARRRPLVKASFNVANQLISACVAVALFELLSIVAHPVVAAILATAWHTLFTNTSVAVVMARVERAPLVEAFRERFSVEIAFQAALGASVGLVFLALWDYHPLALFAALPFILLARQFAEYRLRSERILAVHDRITRLSSALSRATRREELAEEILAAVGDLFRVSRATLVLVGRHGESHATWTRTFPHEPRTWGKLDAALPGSDGLPIGVISVDIDRAAAEHTSESPAAMLRLLAQEAGAALERHEQSRKAQRQRA